MTSRWTALSSIAGWISGGTVTDVGHPVAIVGLAVTRVGRRITVVSHPLACIDKPIALVGLPCALVGCAITLVGERLSARYSVVSVADVGVGRGLALIPGASGTGWGLGGFAFVSGVSQLEAGGVAVDQLGVAVERCRTPMLVAGDRIAHQPRVAFRGGAGALEPLTGVLGKPLRAVGAGVMVVWA